MKKVYFIFIFIFIQVFLCRLLAQNVEFTKTNFPDDPKGLKTAVKNIKVADKLFVLGEMKYPQALEYYLKANVFNSENALLNYKIGKCYLPSVEKEKALYHFEKSHNLKPNVEQDVLYQIAVTYHALHQFETAILKLKEFKNVLTPKLLVEKGKEIDKRIAECQNGLVLIQNPVRVFIDNMGQTVNSQYSEYSPIVNADETQLFFTSRRNTTTGGKLCPIDGKYFEDIWISHRSTYGWGTPQNPGKPLNSELHDAIIGISPDGQKLFLYRGENGGDIFECELKGNSWSKPKALNKNINSKYHESSASLSPDGKKLYFVSDKPGGFGGRDIYVSMLDKKGNWNPSQILPGAVNTEYDEEGVFAHPDGKTLYFSSKGHTSMGGYDIFKSTFENGKWSVPENLGYPINTAGDDVFFSISASGRHGYYASERPEGYGEHDLYMITFLGSEKQMVNNSDDNLLAWKTQPVTETVIEQVIDIKTASLTLLKGKILDDVTRSPIEATITLSDIDKNEELAVFKSNSASGRYLVSLPSGKNYGISAEAPGYLFHSENFNIPEQAVYQEIEKDIYLKKVAVGSSIVLKNIFFDFNQASLRPESINELQRLIKLMNEISTLKIEISGHTDNIGSSQYNKTLSERRAKAVVDYLIENGISANRLTYKGYGFDMPVAPNDTDEGRQQNRRTEFKVISN
jgi:outer membrane protein OmpA-like peptidoglycan-associated protein